MCRQRPLNRRPLGEFANASSLYLALFGWFPGPNFQAKQTLGTRGDLRQNAVRIIAVDPPIAPARTRRLVADSLRKSRRDLAVDLQSPPLFASEASVCDSDRYPKGRDTRRVAR